MDENEGLEVIDGINVVRSMFDDEGEAYGQTQWDDRIKDGSLMLFRDGVIIMCTAWPVIACGPEYPEFHYLMEDVTWDTHEGGKYQKSFELAQKIFERESQTDKEYEVYYSRIGQPFPDDHGRKKINEKSEAAATQAILTEYPDAIDIMVFRK